MSSESNPVNKIIQYLLWGCLYLVLLIPIIISSEYMFPFITGKTIYFRILVEIALFLYIILALSNSCYRPKLNKTAWFIIIFGLVVFITALTGLNPHKSLWGNIERGEGFLTLSHVLIFGLIISQTFKTKTQWYKFFTAGILVVLYINIYALAQKAGASWTINNSQGRLSSTLGNAAYLGGFSLGYFWIATLLAIHRKYIAWKIFLILFILFDLYILFNTQTRGALIGFFASILIAATFTAIKSNNKKVKKISILIIMILVFTSLFIWTNRNSAWISQIPGISRLVSIKANSITAESRLLAWDSSWQGWKDRFLIGYGWENFNVAFNKYFHPEIFRDKGSQIWFDRAHNTILDVAVASGIIGLIAYLAIFISSIKNLYNYAKKNLLIAMPIASFLIAHFIQNIFVFDSLPTYIMLFSVLGFVIYLQTENQPDTEIKAKLKPINPLAVILGTIILIPTIIYFNLQPAQANKTGLESIKYFYIGNINKAVELFDQAVNMNTYQTIELRQKFAERVINLIGANHNLTEEKIESLVYKAGNEIQASIKANKYDAQNYLYLMSLYNSYSHKDRSLAQQSFYWGQKAIPLSPTRPQIYFELGRASINMGQIEQGIAYFKTGVELNPKNYDSHWSLLTAYALTGNLTQAQSQYQHMLDIGMTENISSLERLANLYTIGRAKQELVPIYQKLIELNPTQKSYWNALAELYLELGEKNKADALAIQMEKLNLSTQ